MFDVTIAAHAVEYRVGDAVLVGGVDFTARPGELAAVIGPNGAGKSTLLALLAGDLRPTSGRVSLNDVDLRTLGAPDLALVRSMLTQRSAIDVPYTVGEVVAMGRFPHRRDEANSSAVDLAAVRSAMERTDTIRFVSRVYATLSGGERTRVSFARVLAQDTPVVLLDEPTTALDVAHQESILAVAQSLAAEGRTVVLVLHDLNAAAVHADRVVLMDEGRVAAEGTPRHVLEADRLSAVYGHPMVVVDHPFRDCPLVLTE